MLVLIPYLCASVASARSILVRAAMPCRVSIVATLNQSRNSATLWVVPMASAFCVYHMLLGCRRQERGDHQWMYWGEGDQGRLGCGDPVSYWGIWG